MKRNTRKINYESKTFGPFTVTAPSTRKRYWHLRCINGHTCERRIDTVARLKPESIHCLDCDRWKPTKPANRADLLQALNLTRHLAAQLLDLLDATEMLATA